ncbi:BRCA1-associated RING domain protein 1 [Lampris incognitus]|uniref:BRCA1-associated RING domain protein 1 n=1 Tax=Lampris incognitus TaxID=2546036 RepID=UPI0024B5A8BE|nr:BRCA1-associated RING domain protein 1 [Lampris incognitus]
MDGDLLAQRGDWTRTKEAVANFRKLLLCSKCSRLLSEPVCLGACEHMLCRSCAGLRAGDGCAVCHSPAWVKDIQINKQLSNITQLFCGLESLLNGTEKSGNSSATPQAEPVNVVLKHKKNLKIWYSPHSRKVRCVVRKQPEAIRSPHAPPDCGSGTDVNSALPNTFEAESKDLSVFNFVNSSQDFSAPSPQRPKNKRGRRKRGTTVAPNRISAACGAGQVTRKQTRQRMKTQQLDDINQQWGISKEEVTSGEGKQVCAEKEEQMHCKRVSFISPDATLEEPQPSGPKENADVVSPNRRILKGTLSGDCPPLPKSPDPSTHSTDISPSHQNALSVDVPKPIQGTGEQDGISPHQCTPKRSRAEMTCSASENTPKRHRASPCQRRILKCQEVPYPGGSRSLLTPPAQASPRYGQRTKSPLAKQGHSPSTPGGHSLQGSPAIMKRNHKGETPLHVAAIKGDVDTTTELLDQGADPNLKDNAGWTPLHEACNLGHLAVVEVLVMSGALLNTPGYENDSPLHDAVRNGRHAVVKLLLQHGASQNVMNLHGKRPVDYAITPEMQDIFRTASEVCCPTSEALSPSSNFSTANSGVTRDEQVVILTSKLSQPQQKQLTKLCQQLGGKMVNTFSDAVSHVLVPDGPMPTTLSCLLGILAGCWVLRYSWAEACVQAGEWTPESEHEAGESPRRSHINRCGLLPPLFDGCFFFFLGTFENPPKQELAQLLREGGGQLLCRQPKPDSDVTQTLNTAAYHAAPGSDQALCTQYILYDPKGPHRPAVVKRGKVWSAPSTWLIECIAAFRLLPVPDPPPK